VPSGALNVVERVPVDQEGEGRRSPEPFKLRDHLSDGSEDGGSREGDGEEDDEDNDVDEDDEYEDIVPLFKPVFVPKQVRHTEQARQAKADEERTEAARLEARQEQRIRETHEYIANVLAKEDKMIVNGGSLDQDDAELPDDEDRSEDDEVEYALWKVREMRRLLRDKEAARLRECHPTA
jgi:microfibrillar-associated protein 1